ncbi:hypothetical protein AB0O69_09665 [Streptomyces xiamenensis]|uniref:RipA family octameric membrane protein n=1 Tax=Streptomyces xiamenensis TaxID=408015 RepID=UPI00343BEFDF
MDADGAGENGAAGRTGLVSPRAGGEPVAATAHAERQEVLELYKLAVEMADRVSSRRGAANTYYLSLQTALVTLIGFGMPRLSESPWWVSLVVALGGVTLSLAWWMQLRSYRTLNMAKFRVIHSLEKHLPVRIFTDEWVVLKSPPSPGRFRRYAELGTPERMVPWVFALAHLTLFTGTLSL